MFVSKGPAELTFDQVACPEKILRTGRVHIKAEGAGANYGKK